MVVLNVIGKVKKVIDNKYKLMYEFIRLMKIWNIFFFIG